MADIECKYRDAEHTIDTFDNVISTVDWIKDALRVVLSPSEELVGKCIIDFDAGDISYECKSIDEFKQYAFGKNINVKTMTVWVSENWASALISVYAIKARDEGLQEFILSSNNEKLLVDLRDALRAKKKGIPLNTVHTVINNYEKHEDNSIHIGNNNSISSSAIGTNSTAKVISVETIEESPKEKWYSKCLWQIVIPIIVGIVVTALCIWLGLSK